MKSLIALVLATALAASCGAQQSGGGASAGGSPGSSGPGDGVVSHDVPPGSQTLKAIKATPVKPEQVAKIRKETGDRSGWTAAELEKVPVKD